MCTIICLLLFFESGKNTERNKFHLNIHMQKLAFARRLWNKKKVYENKKNINERQRLLRKLVVIFVLLKLAAALHLNLSGDK